MLGKCAVGLIAAFTQVAPMMLLSSAGAAPPPRSPALETVYKCLLDTGRHGTFLSLVDAAGFKDRFSTPQQVTIFAPTDAAFAQLPSGAMAMLLLPQNMVQLRTIVLVEAIAQGAGSASVPTLEGEPLTATAPGGTVALLGAKGSISHLIETDLPCGGSIMHVTDTILKAHHEPLTPAP